MGGVVNPCLLVTALKKKNRTKHWLGLGLLKDGGHLKPEGRYLDFYLKLGADLFERQKFKINH